MGVRRYRYDGSQDVCAIFLDNYLMKQIDMKKYILSSEVLNLCEGKTDDISMMGAKKMCNMPR